MLAGHPYVQCILYMYAVIIFGLRFAFFTHISGGEKRTVSKYVR